MEIYLALSLLGLGVYLNKDGIVERKREIKKVSSESANSNTIYDSKRSKKVENTVEYIGEKIFQQRDDEMNTVLNNINDDIKRDVDNRDNGVYESMLSGEKLSLNDFSHNNMVPFFGGSMKQSTFEFANKSILEHYTGVGDTYKNKKEQDFMFKPVQNMGNVNGMTSNDDFYKERIVEPIVRNNVLPFKQMRIGPGINRGFNDKPYGGFHQLETRDYVMPKTVDQLRVLTKPKTTYEGRIISGQKEIQRGKIGIFEKNRPERYFKHNPNRYFTTVGANTRNTQRAKYLVKDTNRIDTHKEYVGPGESTNKRTKARPNIKKSTNNEYRDTGLRNVSLNIKWKNDEKNDYGKNNLVIDGNERDITCERTHITNVGSIVKAITAPLEDIMKTSIKEDLIDNPNKLGNISLQIPPKATIYDPNDIARTTIKETNVHDVRTGNISRLALKATIYDPNDIARTTIKETNVHDVRTGNFSNLPKKLTVYDPNDIARTTVKETNIHDARLGNLHVKQVTKFRDPDFNAKTTTKETVNMDDILNFKGAEKSTVYDPNDIARTTIKETNIDDTRIGNFERGVLESGSAYKVTEYDAPLTQRQFLSDNEYTGIADSYLDKPMSYSDVYNATLNEVRELTLEGRSPTNSSVKLNVGEEDINMEIKKIASDENNPHIGNRDKIYNNIPHTIPCSITNDKMSLPNEILDDRLDSTILDAFNNNPYTKPLNSYF